MTWLSAYVPEVDVIVKTARDEVLRTQFKRSDALAQLYRLYLSEVLGVGLHSNYYAAELSLKYIFMLIIYEILIIHTHLSFILLIISQPILFNYSKNFKLVINSKRRLGQ